MKQKTRSGFLPQLSLVRRDFKILSPQTIKKNTETTFQDNLFSLENDSIPESLKVSMLKNKHLKSTEIDGSRYCERVTSFATLSHDVSYLHTYFQNSKSQTFKTLPNSTLHKNEDQHLKRFAKHPDDMYHQMHQFELQKEKPYDSTLADLQRKQVDAQGTLSTRLVDFSQMVQMQNGIQQPIHRVQRAKHHPRSQVDKLPPTRAEVLELQEWLSLMLTQVERDKSTMSLKEIVEQIQLIYSTSLKEIIRQCSLQCLERGELLHRIWDYYVELMEQIVHSYHDNTKHQEQESLNEVTRLHKSYGDMVDLQRHQFQALTVQWNETKLSNDQFVKTNSYMKTKLLSLSGEIKQLHLNLDDVKRERSDLLMEIMALKSADKGEEDEGSIVMDTPHSTHNKDSIVQHLLQFRNHTNTNPEVKKQYRSTAVEMYDDLRRRQSVMMNELEQIQSHSPQAKGQRTFTTFEGIAVENLEITESSTQTDPMQFSQFPEVNNIIMELSDAKEQIQHFDAQNKEIYDKCINIILSNESMQSEQKQQIVSVISQAALQTHTYSTLIQSVATISRLHTRTKQKTIIQYVELRETQEHVKELEEQLYDATSDFSSVMKEQNLKINALKRTNKNLKNELETIQSSPAEFTMRRRDKTKTNNFPGQKRKSRMNDPNKNDEVLQEIYRSQQMPRKSNDMLEVPDHELRQQSQQSLQRSRDQQNSNKKRQTEQIETNSDEDVSQSKQRLIAQITNDQRKVDEFKQYGSRLDQIEESDNNTNSDDSQIDDQIMENQRQSNIMQLEDSDGIQNGIHDSIIDNRQYSREQSRDKNKSRKEIGTGSKKVSQFHSKQNSMYSNSTPQNKSQAQNRSQAPQLEYSQTYQQRAENQEEQKKTPQQQDESMSNSGESRRSSQDRETLDDLHQFSTLDQKNMKDRNSRVLSLLKQFSNDRRGHMIRRGRKPSKFNIQSNAPKRVKRNYSQNTNQANLLLQDVLKNGKNTVPNMLSLPQVVKVINIIVAEAVRNEDGFRVPLYVGVYDFFLNKYGFKKVAEKHIRQVLQFVYAHRMDNSKTKTIAQLCYMASEMDDMSYKLYIDSQKFFASPLTKQVEQFIPLDTVQQYLAQQIWLDTDNKIQIDVTSKNVEYDWFMNEVMKLYCSKKQDYKVSLRQLFEAADLDGNKLLAFSEFKMIYREIHPDTYNKQQAIQLFIQYADYIDESSKDKMITLPRFAELAIEQGLFAKVRIQKYQEGYGNLFEVWADEKNLIKYRFIEANKYREVKYTINLLNDYINKKQDEQGTENFDMESKNNIYIISPSHKFQATQNGEYEGDFEVRDKRSYDVSTSSRDPNDSTNIQDI